MEKSRGADDQVDAFSQALNRLRGVVSLPTYAPPMQRPPTGDCEWMAAGVGSAPWQAAAQVRDRASAATRLIGQNRSGEVLFPSANNPPGEVWCSVNA
jgi:hypothetical protein